MPARAADRTATGRPAVRRRRIAVLSSLLVLLVALGAGGWWLLTAGPLAGSTVPDVTGRTLDDAVAALEADGFTPELEETYSDDVTEGNVVGTTPGAGERTRSQSIVVLVSQGVEMLTVPDAAGRSLADATELLTAARLTVGEVRTEYHDTVPAGEVITSSPAPGQVVPHDRPVELVVSDGREPALVPDVVGEPQATAEASIEDVGLVPTATEAYSDTVAPGHVISQDPLDGEAFVGDEVAIVVSLGPELVEVPDLLNYDVDDAVAELEALGLQPEREDILGAFYGTVRGQTPAAGEMVERGTVVTLRVV